MGQMKSASTFANKVDRTNTNNGIHSPMPSRNLLWMIKLTIGREAVAIRRKMDVSMAIEPPDVVAAHFGCCTSDKFGRRCLPWSKMLLILRRIRIPARLLFDFLELVAVVRGVARPSAELAFTVA